MFPAAQVREPFSAIRVLAQGVSLPLMYKLVPPADDEQSEAVPQLGQHLSALDQSLSELPKFSEWRRMGVQKRLGFEELWLDAHDQLRALLSGAESDDVLRWIREPDSATSLFTVLQHSVQSGPLAAAKATRLPSPLIHMGGHIIQHQGSCPRPRDTGGALRKGYLIEGGESTPEGLRTGYLIEGGVTAPWGALLWPARRAQRLAL